MKLYSVITIVPGWPSAESEKFGGIRTVAICTSVERAKEIVEGNLGDIFETSYRFVVIVEFESDALYGGLGSRNNEWWYVWQEDSEDGKYYPASKPVEYSRVIFTF